MTDPEIPPALTPDEWQRTLKRRDEIVAWACDEAFGADVSPDERSLAALCLHGQPYGLTQAHLDALRAILGYARDEYNAVYRPFNRDEEDLTPNAREHLQEIRVASEAIKRIAALLPPEASP